MTVLSTKNRNDHLGDGLQTVFNYEYLLLDELHMEVYFDGVIQPSGYTVQDVGNPGGGTVTFAVPPADQVAVTLLRNVPLTQEIDYVEYGPLPAEVLEKEADLDVMRLQQLEEFDQRTLHYDLDGAPDTGATLPDAEANKAIGYDASGNLTNIVIGVGGSPVVNPLQEDLLSGGTYGFITTTDGLPGSENGRFDHTGLNALELSRQGQNLDLRYAAKSLEGIDVLAQNGDLLSYGGSAYQRIGIGGETQVLTTVGGFPTWADAPAGGGSGNNFAVGLGLQQEYTPTGPEVTHALEAGYDYEIHVLTARPSIADDDMVIEFSSVSASGPWDGAASFTYVLDGTVDNTAANSTAFSVNGLVLENQDSSPAGDPGNVRIAILNHDNAGEPTGYRTNMDSRDSGGSRRRYEVGGTLDLTARAEVAFKLSWQGGSNFVAGSTIRVYRRERVPSDDLVRGPASSVPDNITVFADTSGNNLDDSGVAIATVSGHIADGTIHFTEASINHANIQGVGSNSHAQIDAHIGAGGATHPAFTISANGFTPAPGAGSGTRVLQEDGSWVEQTGGGGSPLTTKGDLFTRDASADARLPVGTTNGHVLKVNSATATGLEWAAESGGGGGVGGSGAAGQIAIWSDGSNIEGNTGLTWVDATQQFVVTSDDGGNNARPRVVLDRNSASPQANDKLGLVEFKGRSTADTERTYAALQTNIISAVDGTEAGRFTMQLLQAGQLVDTWWIESTQQGDINWLLHEETDGSDHGPDMLLHRESPTPAANDEIGCVRFFGDDSAGGVRVEYSRVQGVIRDPTNGAGRQGELAFYTCLDGFVAKKLTVENNGAVLSEVPNYENLVTDPNHLANKAYVDAQGGGFTTAVMTTTSAYALAGDISNGDTLQFFVDEDAAGGGQIIEVVGCTAVLGAGTCLITVDVNGVPVPGLDTPLGITTTPAKSTATGNGVRPGGNTIPINVTVSGVSGAQDLQVSIFLRNTITLS